MEQNNYVPSDWLLFLKLDNSDTVLFQNVSSEYTQYN